MVDHRLCPHCGARNEMGNVTCAACGRSLATTPAPAPAGAPPPAAAPTPAAPAASPLLRHRTCPHCGAENLVTEIVCFACGQPLAARPRPVDRPPVTPAIFYVAALLLVALGGVAAVFLAGLIADYRTQAGIQLEHMLIAVAVLAFAGQWGFYRARCEDRTYWEQKRAPQLPLKQAETGDAVWLRGRALCDAPLFVPEMTDQQCIYYEIHVWERSLLDRGKWHTTRHEKKAVDFRIEQEGASLLVPTGGLTWEAPICVDTYPDSMMHVKVWAIFAGWQVSACGRVLGETAQRRLDRLSEAVPAVITYQYEDNYLNDLAKTERNNRILGWTASILGAVVLLAAFLK